MNTTFCTSASTKRGDHNESEQKLNERQLCDKCNESISNTSNWSSLDINHSVKKSNGEFAALHMSHSDHAHSLGSQLAINPTVQSDSISNSRNSNYRHSSRSDNTPSALSGETDDKMNDAVSRNLNSDIEPELNVLHKWDGSKENECNNNNNHDNEKYNDVNENEEDKSENHASECVHYGVHSVNKENETNNTSTNLKRINKCDNYGEVKEHATPHSEGAESKHENKRSGLEPNHSHGQSDGFLIAAINTEYHQLSAQQPTSELPLPVQHEGNAHTDTKSQIQHGKNESINVVKTLPAEMETPCSDNYDNTCNTMAKQEKQFSQVHYDKSRNVVVSSPHQQHRHLTSAELQRLKNSCASTYTPPPPHTLLEKQQQQQQQQQSLLMLSSLAPAKVITKTPTTSKASTSNATHSAHRLLSPHEIEEMMQIKNTPHASPSSAGKNVSYSRNNNNNCNNSTAKIQNTNEMTKEVAQPERPYEHTPHYQKETVYITQPHCHQTIPPPPPPPQSSPHVICTPDNKTVHCNNTIVINQQSTIKPTPHKVNIQQPPDVMPHAGPSHEHHVCHEIMKPTPQPHVTKMTIIPPPTQPLLPSRNPHVQYNYSLQPNEMQSHSVNRACNCAIANCSDNKCTENNANNCTESTSNEMISTKTDRSNSKNENNDNKIENQQMCHFKHKTNQPEHTSLPHYPHACEHQHMSSSELNSVNQDTNRNKNNNDNDNSNNNPMLQSNEGAGEMGNMAKQSFSAPPAPPPPFYAPPPPLTSEQLSAPESVKPMQTKSPLFPFASDSANSTSWSTTNRTNSAITNSKTSGNNYVNENNPNDINHSYNSHSNSETKYTCTNKSSTFNINFTDNINTTSSQLSSSHVQTGKWNSHTATQTALPSPQLPLPIRESALCPPALPFPSMLSLPPPPQPVPPVPPFQFYPYAASSLPPPMPSNTFQPSCMTFPKSALTLSLSHQPSSLSSSPQTQPQPQPQPQPHLEPSSLPLPYYYPNAPETMPPRATSSTRCSTTNMQDTNAHYEPTFNPNNRNNNNNYNNELDRSCCNYGNFINYTNSSDNNNRQMNYQSKFTSLTSPSIQQLQNEPEYETRNNNNNNNYYKAITNNNNNNDNNNYCTAQTQIASSFNTTTGKQQEQSGQCTNEVAYDQRYYQKEHEHVQEVAHEQTHEKMPECKKQPQTYVQEYNATNPVCCGDDNSNLSHSPNEMVNCTSAYMPCGEYHTTNISVGANELSPLSNNYFAPTNTTCTSRHDNKNYANCFNQGNEIEWNQGYDSSVHGNNTTNYDSMNTTNHTMPYPYGANNYNTNINKANMKIGNNIGNFDQLQYQATSFALTNNATINKSVTNSNSNNISISNTSNRQSAGYGDNNRRRHKISHDNTPQNLKYSQTDPFSMYKHNKMLEQEASKLQQLEDQQQQQEELEQ